MGFVSSTTGNAAHAAQRSAAIDDLQTRMQKLLPELFNAVFMEGGNSPTQAVERARAACSELMSWRTCAPS